ncbi:M48 family metalloprotease [Aquabacterium sp. OR-4]|uniref:M48 family metalloprotease n=1 Tax=Aquabacterium sp. OR-4 TaxID=2978127 RepID=UPI0021B30B8A|nr:M48 family metalloprotease [Aquabacterium sp. OR-4]MDT7838755.1 M48 family metalloprotease [Aquabacterium sp. OR-4]
MKQGTARPLNRCHGLVLMAALLLSGCAEVKKQAEAMAGAIQSSTTPAPASTESTAAARPAPAAAPTTGSSTSTTSGAGSSNSALPGASSTGGNVVAAAAVAKANSVPVNEKALRGLLPDRTCAKPDEQFDVTQKLIQYGGQNAVLRLQRMLTTDFQQAELTPQDRAMLRYIAYTTIWIPQEVEEKAGALWSALASDDSGGGGKAARFKRLAERMDFMRSQASDYPGTARLSQVNTLENGIYAQPGGIVAVSRTFIELLDTHSAAQDLVLAHEFSHLYKRHAIKELQYQLLTSSAGLRIARVLLRKNMGAASDSNVAIEALAYLKVASDLVEFIKTTTTHFGKEQELEADACAVEWLQRAKLDSRGAWAGFKVMAAQAPANDAAYFKLHPSTKERELNYSRRLQNAPRTK